MGSFFTSVSNCCIIDKLKSEIIPASESIPYEVIISVDEVENCLSSIKVHKAIGPDAIPNWILKDCALILSGPLTSIFNSSIWQLLLFQSLKLHVLYTSH